MKNIEYIIGSENMETSPLPVFSDDACELLKLLESRIRNDREARMYPDVISVGYWCRKSNIQKKKAAFGDCSRTVGRGLAFHITPGNIPVNFMFSYFFSLLAGNANIVRIPSRPFPQIGILLRIMSECLLEFPDIARRTAFISYKSDDEITAQFCMKADVRIVWGGDRTVAHIRSFRTKPRCIDVTFADRYSLAIMSAEAICAAEEKELIRIAHSFYNDTYLMDQNACSSPKMCLWTDNNPEGKQRFWQSVAAEAIRQYTLPSSLAVDKYTALCRDVVDRESIESVFHVGNYLHVVSLKGLPAEITGYSGKGGYFYETELNQLDQIGEILDNQKIQTVVYHGVDPEKILGIVINRHLKGVDRIVPIGSAMDIDSDWDGFDLIRTMSRTIAVK